MKVLLSRAQAFFCECMKHYKNLCVRRWWVRVIRSAVRFASCVIFFCRCCHVRKLHMYASRKKVATDFRQRLLRFILLTLSVRPLHGNGQLPKSQFVLSQGDKHPRGVHNREEFPARRECRRCSRRLVRVISLVAPHLEHVAILRICGGTGDLRSRGAHCLPKIRVPYVCPLLLSVPFALTLPKPSAACASLARARAGLRLACACSDGREVLTPQIVWSLFRCRCAPGGAQLPHPVRARGGGSRFWPVQTTQGNTRGSTYTLVYRIYRIRSLLLPYVSITFSTGRQGQKLSGRCYFFWSVELPLSVVFKTGAR